MPLRLVLDTNVWLDWLVFNDPAVASIQSAVAAGQVEIFIGLACLRELEQALTYKLQKRILDATAQTACLVECRRVSQIVNDNASSLQSAKANGNLPVCRDPDDQKFLELARDCRADFLLTKDRALLELARRKLHPAPFRIVTPQHFTEALAIRD